MTLSDSWDTPPSNPNNRRSSVILSVQFDLFFYSDLHKLSIEQRKFTLRVLDPINVSHLVTFIIQWLLFQVTKHLIFLCLAFTSLSQWQSIKSFDKSVAINNRKYKLRGEVGDAAPSANKSLQEVNESEPGD